MKASNRHFSHQRPRCHGRSRPALGGGHVRHYGALRAPGRTLRDDRRGERSGEHVPRGGLRRPCRPRPGGDRKQLGSGLLRVRPGSAPDPGLRRVRHLRAGASVLDRGHRVRAPEIGPYLLSLPPAERLLMQRVPGDRWQGYRTVAGMVAVITAVLAGSTAALAAILIFDHSLGAAVISGTLVALPTMIAMIRYQDSAWERAAAEPLRPGEA